MCSFKPPIVTKAYHLNLSHQFVEKHPDTAEAIWTMLAKVREERYLTIYGNYVGEKLVGQLTGCRGTGCRITERPTAKLSTDPNYSVITKALTHFPANSVVFASQTKGTGSIRASSRATLAAGDDKLANSEGCEHSA